MELDTVTINFNLNHDMAKKKAKGRKKNHTINWPFTEMSLEQLNQELDEENAVDLDKTVWKVLRSKPPVNNILKHY